MSFRREIGVRLIYEQKDDPWWSATFQVEYEPHKGVVEKDGKGKGYTICATKSVRAAPERCYEMRAAGVLRFRTSSTAHTGNLDGGCGARSGRMAGGPSDRRRRDRRQVRQPKRDAPPGRWSRTAVLPQPSGQRNHHRRPPPAPGDALSATRRPTRSPVRTMR